VDCSRAIHEQVLKKIVIPLKIVAVFEPSENSCQSSEESGHFSEKKNSLWRGFGQGWHWTCVGRAIGCKFRATLPQVATRKLQAHTNGGRPAAWTAESGEALQQTGSKNFGVEGVLSCS
jgi:hypothetical protein